MKTQVLQLDLSKKDGFSEALPRISSISSYSANWQGIQLEFHQVPPFEFPEYTCQQHIITIPTISGLRVERTAEGKTHDLVFHPGNLCISAKDTSLRTRWEQDLEAIQLILEPDVLARAAYEMIDPDRIELSCHVKTHDPLVYNLGVALKQSLETFGSDSKLYADSAATFLAVHILQHYTTKQPKPKDALDGLSRLQLKRAIDYIHAYIAEDICLDSVASQLGLSRYYFCRLFKRSTGYSPYQYIIRCRVERAKELLKQGRLTLGEVAIACGFSHQSHLHRHFKRLTGVTPQRFVNS